MKRSFRRARKSYRPRKAKRYFKSRISRRYNRPDVGYSEKVVFTRNMIVDAQNNFTWFNFHWMATGNSGAHDVYFNDQTQFNQLVPLWKEYKITGVSVKYLPDTFYIGNANKTMHAIECGTQMNTLNPNVIPAPELQQTLDYRAYKANRSFQRFYRVYKYARSKDVGWRSTMDAQGVQYNAVPDCTTGMGAELSGFNAGDSVARVEVTWYIKFRTRTKQ